MDETWNRYTTAGIRGERRPTDRVELGPNAEPGLDRKLLGDVDGLRILELGTGAGHSAIALARNGAKVVACDPDAEQITRARANVEAAEVHVELHNADHADLAFLHADVFDAVVSVHALAAVDDLARVFRQVHRVLKADRPLLMSFPHPAALMVETDNPEQITSAYGDGGTLGVGHNLTHRRSISDIFTKLTRSNYRVDQLLEPTTDGNHPASLIVRARKLGT
jgi:SAM-dependent methyltransferase